VDVWCVFDDSLIFFTYNLLKDEEQASDQDELSSRGAEAGPSHRGLDAGQSHRNADAPPSRRHSKAPSSRHSAPISLPTPGSASNRPRRAAAISADKAARAAAMIEPEIDRDEDDLTASPKHHGSRAPRRSASTAARSPASSPARAPPPKQKSKTNSGAWAVPNNVKPDFTINMWSRVSKMPKGAQITDSDFWSFFEAHGLPKKPLRFTVYSILSSLYLYSIIKLLEQTPCLNCAKAHHPCIFWGKTACLRCQTRKQGCQGGVRPQLGKENRPSINRRIELLKELKRMGRYEWPSHFLDEKGARQTTAF
jgi:hypothetical protein